jgi:hypothetical protein
MIRHDTPPVVLRHQYVLLTIEPQQRIPVNRVVIGTLYAFLCTARNRQSIGRSKPFRNGLVARAGRRSAPGWKAPVSPLGLRGSGVSRRSAVPWGKCAGREVLIGGNTPVRAGPRGCRSEAAVPRFQPHGVLRQSPGALRVTRSMSQLPGSLPFA